MPQTRNPTSVLSEVEMITGDAVTLAVPPAPLALRIAAACIDLVVLVLLQVGLYLAGARVLAGSSSAALIAAAITVIAILVLVVWPTTFETVSGGRSPGKLICGTRVVRDDGGPITFRHAVTRAILGTVELYGSFSMAALISAMVSRRHQRLGDRLAGTYVVRSRTAWSPSQPMQMPPQLAAWAAIADLERVPAAEIGWCRRFMTRRTKIAADARARAAHALVLRVAPWILPPPPPATDEDLLAAILAERYRREQGRLQADATTVARLLAGDHRAPSSVEAP